MKVLVTQSCLSDFTIPWTVALQVSLSMEFSRQDYWSKQPVPSPGDLPDLGIEPVCPTLEAYSLPSEPLGKPMNPRNTIKYLAAHSVFGLSGLWARIFSHRAIDSDVNQESELTSCLNVPPNSRDQFHWVNTRYGTRCRLFSIGKERKERRGKKERRKEGGEHLVFNFCS